VYLAWLDVLLRRCCFDSRIYHGVGEVEGSCIVEGRAWLFLGRRSRPPQDRLVLLERRRRPWRGSLDLLCSFLDGVFSKGFRAWNERRR
jgi:hypothetical protein